MAGINFDVIRSRFQIEMPVISGLESSIAHVAASYGSLAESFREISDITRLPAFVLPGATREIYTTSFALETLRPWDERDEDVDEAEIQFRAEAELETSGCITLLQQVDPGLARPYIGARDALYGNNADRARHILSSLRELWNHLLRRLAPDDLVAAWIPGMPNYKDLLHEGKPTRRARVLFICRELNNDPLTDFFMYDTQALVKLIELFNRVHELETQLTDEQLRAILLKTDSWLMYILQISVDNFHNWTGGDHAKETRITSCSPERQCDEWDVKKDVSTRSSGHFDKKQDTVDAGHEISQKQSTEFYIHSKDSHGDDPYPPKE